MHLRLFLNTFFRRQLLPLERAVEGGIGGLIWVASAGGVLLSTAARCRLALTCRRVQRRLNEIGSM